MSNDDDLFKRYLSVETAGGARWHPDGDKIVFIYDGSGNYQVYETQCVKDLQIWPERKTYIEDRSTCARYLDDGTIVFTRDKDGNENFQLFVIDKNGKEKRLSSDDQAKHLIHFHNKTYLYFTANIEDKTRFDVYRYQIPVTENAPEIVFKQKKQGLYAPQIVSEDNKMLIVSEYKSNRSQELLLVNTEKNEVKNITKPITGEQETRWAAIRWIDAEHVLVQTDFDSDLYRLAIIDLVGNFYKIEQLESFKQYEVEKTIWSTNTPYTFFEYNEDGYSSLYRAIFSPEGVENIEEISLPKKGLIVSGDARSFTTGMNLSPDANKLLITFSSSKLPTNVWVIDLETNDYWQVTKTDTAGLDPKAFVDANLERFKSFDGIEVPYFKYLPKTTKPQNGYPTIFIIHGGPESQYKPAFSPQVQFFIQAGFAIIAPNIRGSAGYGTTYLDLDNVEKRLDSIKDIKHLALHLKENDPDVNPEKFCVFGGSYGGFAVLSAMTEHPELWVAGVDIVGVSNFVTFLKNTASWRRRLREKEYGSLDKDRETLERISPINQIENITAPLFIIHGDNDERVPVSETIQMYEKLKEKELDVKMLRFDDEGHGITKLSNKIKVYSEVLDWLKKIVKVNE